MTYRQPRFELHSCVFLRPLCAFSSKGKYMKSPSQSPESQMGKGRTQPHPTPPVTPATKRKKTRTTRAHMAFAEYFTNAGMDIETVSDCLADALRRHLESALHAVGGDYSKVFLIMDLDETMWTPAHGATQGALGSAHWLALISDDYHQLTPEVSYSDLQADVLRVCDVILGHIEVKSCDEGTVKLIAEWRGKGAKVIAATARMNTMARGTHMQQSNLSGLKFCDLSPDVPAIEAKMRALWAPHDGWPGLCHENGIWFLSMANKGLFLKAILDEDVACVFADDTRKHLMRSQEALGRVLPYHSCIHYTGAVDESLRVYNEQSSDTHMGAICTRLLKSRCNHFQELLATDNLFFRTWLHRVKSYVPEMEQVVKKLK